MWTRGEHHTKTEAEQKHLPSTVKRTFKIYEPFFGVMVFFFIVEKGLIAVDFTDRI